MCCTVTDRLTERERECLGEMKRVEKREGERERERERECVCVCVSE
jgi:hypothetical protein